MSAPCTEWFADETSLWLKLRRDASRNIPTHSKTSSIACSTRRNSSSSGWGDSGTSSTRASRERGRASDLLYAACGVRNGVTALGIEALEHFGRAEELERVVAPPRDIGEHLTKAVRAVVPGWYVRPAWLWAKRRPNILDVLAELGVR